MKIRSNETVGKRLLNVQEAARYLGLEVDTVYKKARLRELPHVKVGRALRFDVKALERYIEQNAKPIFALKWSDILYQQELIAVRAMLKGGKMRYVPMPLELATEIKRFPAIIGEDRIFLPKHGAKGKRQRVEGSFETILKLAGIDDFRFHDLRHTFASWYMMNGGDLYELAKILGHSNIKMTERYAKLAKGHIAKTGNTAREIWKLMQPEAGDKEQTGA